MPRPGDPWARGPYEGDSENAAAERRAHGTSPGHGPATFRREDKYGLPCRQKGYDQAKQPSDVPLGHGQPGYLGAAILRDGARYCPAGCRPKPQCELLARLYRRIRPRHAETLLNDTLRDQGRLCPPLPAKDDLDLGYGGPTGRCTQIKATIDFRDSGRGRRHEEEPRAD